MIHRMFKFSFITALLIMFSINISNAEIVKKINIEGNQRISNETIILFSEVDVNFDLKTKDINQIIKNLYSTDFFDLVNVNLNSGILTIKIIENKIIQEVIINGIKAKKLEDLIYESLILKNKSSYVKYSAKKDLTNIKNSLKSSGYFFVQVDSSIEENINNNTINLIYDIDLGKKASIGKIRFSGDKIYKDRKLKSLIVSEESKPWKFLSNKKYLDENRIKLDKKLLKNFYLDKGYFQVDINHSSAEFSDQGNFDLIFNISSGEIFTFNKVNLVLPQDYEARYFEDIAAVLNTLKGEHYSFSRLEDILEEIDKVALLQEFEFITANVEEKVVDSNKLDFSIIISESKKSYVERIDILGNDITIESVIRNSLLIDEGDAFNEILLNKSVNKLKAKNIFSSVKSKTAPGSSNNKINLSIEIEEKPTGEISAGAGIGTTGGSLTFGIKENNYLGKDIKLNTRVTISNNSVRGVIAYTQPNFRYSDKALTTSFENSATDLMKTSGYKTNKTGVSLGTKFEQYEDIFLSPKLVSYRESIEVSSDATAAMKKQDGDYFDLAFIYGVDYDKRDRYYQPTEGHRSYFSQTLPVVSDEYALENRYLFEKYTELLTEDMIGKIAINLFSINSLSDDDVRLSKRITLPEQYLRGFKSGKIGPKDGADYIGGNYAATLNISTNLPLIFPTLQNTDFLYFVDFANGGGVDYNSNLDNKSKIRSSTGVAVDWSTPIGPLNFSLSYPITKAATDATETFRFS